MKSVAAIIVLLGFASRLMAEVPSFLNYTGVVNKLSQWQQTYPNFVDVGTYGVTLGGQPLYCLRMTNKSVNTAKYKVLITGAIHGNESLGTAMVMGYIGTILELHDKQGNQYLQDMLATRDIYFIPVISPDAYPNVRETEGVDPNRNFPTRENPNKVSISPIEALKRFMLQMRFDAVASGHTAGRVYLYPWGDTRQKCKDNDAFLLICRGMASFSGYDVKQCCYSYPWIINGTEADWFYRQGAFAIVIEYGPMSAHGHPPDNQTVATEFLRCYYAIIYFIKEAPLAIKK